MSTASDGTSATEAGKDEVVVTGLGAVSPFGWGCEPLWEGLLSGRSAMREPERLDTRSHRTREAGEVPPPPEELVASHAEWSDWSWADRFAVAAAEEAVRQAFPDGSFDGGACGGYFGGSTAGMWEGERFFRALLDGRSSRLRDLSSHQLNGPGDAVARALDLRGPVVSLSSACASGALAIGEAIDALHERDVDVALAGGSDALCQLTYAGFNALRAVDADRCRPFRAGRAGLNLGEGAGMLVLERRESVELRGGRPLARLLAAGASCDAHHMTAPHPEGEGAARAVAAALREAGVEARQVTFVNAHGTGTPLNDSAEAAALRALFGPDAPPVTSVKGAVGHFLGAAGAVEAVVSVLAIQRGLIPPTHGEGILDEDCPIDLVRGEPRALDDGACVSTSFAFGGANAALVFAPAERRVE